MDTPHREVICTLPVNDVDPRLTEWHDLMARAVTVDRQAGRIRAAFGFVDFPEVRRLVAAEQSCCAFLDFAIDAEGDLVELAIASDDPNAQPVLDALFGVAAR